MSKQYKSGLVLGKFYPFHMGHKYLIDSAAEKCDAVTVLVCSLKIEQVPGTLRYDWIRQTYRDVPHVRVIHVTDEVVQYPASDEDERFWDIWTGIIMRELPNFDVVFTSETYGQELAKRINHKYPNMNISSVDVDNSRETYPVSGTSIRLDPYSNWDYIPDIVKPFFMQKVILVGPESSGKSVLAKKLADAFGNKHVPEYGREYVDEHIIGKRQLELKDLEYIAIGYITQAESIALDNAKNADNSKVLILDTDLIITQIWSEIYFKKVPAVVKSLQGHYIQTGDLYLLMKPDIPWIDDGTREFPYLREWHYERIKKELDKRNLKYYIIDGDIHTFDKRFDLAMTKINNFFMKKFNKS